VSSRTEIERARDAVARHDWVAAYDGFRSVDAATLAARDLEGFADAAWWCGHLDESLDARQRASAAYEAEGDGARVVATAARVAAERFAHGEPSIGAGYLQRARRFAEQIPDGPEHGFLRMVEASAALHATGDPDGAVLLARDAAAIGRRFGDRDLVAMALHVEGLAAIDAGRVQEGVALLDEAMTGVLAGDLNPFFTGIIFCSLIASCLELQDVRRAGEWSDAATAWCAGLPSESPFTGLCRVNRAEVARLRGSWEEAEREAARAAEELATFDPGAAAGAFLQLAEIRRRRGDLVEAETAFARAHELGGEPQPGLALLRLAQGETGAARAALRAALAAEHQLVRRARLLAARAEIDLADGDRDQARAATAELARLASETDSPALRASAAQADGAPLLADDDPAAIERLRGSVTAWRDARLPYETARAQALLGQALRTFHDDEGAALELRAAAEALERLGAAPEARAVAAALGPPEALPDGLTRREAEVLRLVAAGKTNRDIAVELVISEHTVSRHLQNMFTKMGVSSRAAATAYAYEHGLA
jgi:DNA-binding CsgD family transcriptional regulator